MGQGEIVLLVLSLVRNWNDVIDFQIATLKFQVDWPFTNEANVVLPLPEAVLKLPALLWLESRKKE
jgi:hypothetical protein